MALALKIINAQMYSNPYYGDEECTELGKHERRGDTFLFVFRQLPV